MELSYKTAADLHTVLNGGNEEEKGIFASIREGITKGIPATAVAAWNDIANIPATVGNFVTRSDKYEITNTADRLAALDDDLAAYYEDHKMGIDTAGFIVGSFAPGFAGVKVLRAGQKVLQGAIGAGKFGQTTGAALGLMPGSREKYLAAAMEQIGTTGNVFKLGEANLIKAFTAGIGQNALEGAAFTAMVNATMHQSPILDDRDVSDLTWDVLVGAAMGGAIGGIFQGTGSVIKVKGAAEAANREVHPWTIAGLGGDIVGGNITASDKILYKLRQLEAIPHIDPAHALASRIGRVAKKTEDTLKLEIRELASTLTTGDQDIVEQLITTIKNNSLEDNIKNLWGAEKISRVGASSKIEKTGKSLKDKVTNMLNALDSTADDIAEAKAYTTSFIDLRNGVALADKPTLLNLADRGTVSITKSGVQAGKANYAAKAGIDAAKASHLEVEARQLFLESAPKLDAEKLLVVHPNDIALMQKAARDGVQQVSIADKVYTLGDDLNNVIRTRQQELAAELIAARKPMPEVQKLVNAHADVLTGTVEMQHGWNYRQWVREATKGIMEGDPHLQPTYLKIVSKKEAILADGFLVEGLAAIDQKVKLYSEQAALIAAKHLKRNFISAAGIKNKIIGESTGPGFVSSESGPYGSQSSFWAYIGQQTHTVKKEWIDYVKEIFNANLSKLSTNVDDAIAWSTLHENMRNLPQGYYLADDGAALVFGKVPVAADYSSEAAFEKAMKAYAKKQAEMEAAGIPTRVELKSPLIRTLVKDHIAVNAKNRGAMADIHANNGYQHHYDPDVFYPIPRNPKDTPYFAFVVDESVSGRGHSKMIYAASNEKLELMRNEIMSDPDLRARGINVLMKGEAEEYYKSIGKFEFERTLSDNYINAELLRKGKSASFLPMTDPARIATSTMEWHEARAAATVRSLVEHRYAAEFETLRATAEPAIQASKSKFGYISPLAYAENTVKNPAANLIKMALDISKADEYPLWTPLNKFLDGAYSALVGKISSVFANATTTNHLDEINSALKKAGYKDVIVDDMLYEAMNGAVPRGKLSNIVAKANGLLATFALRSDPFNAINNTVGHGVLLAPETKYVIKGIMEGNEAAVGELAKLAKIVVPGTGGKETTLSASKMIARRIGMFHTDKTGREWMRQHGFSTLISEQYDQAIDFIATAVAKGDESSLQKAMTLIKGFGDKAEKWTGNKLAEEFNRYIAAGVMKDITDIAVKHGILDDQTALAYINTFVNRTQGNYLASQRPVLFQGPLGQAMGLFQTYQFNLLNQVFRYVGEGQNKIALIMAGMQGGIYGMNGLPAFQAINTHIIGNAPGNTAHTSLYEAVLSGAGHEAGEWLLYGGLSNGLSLFHPDLKTNIYSRGDVNPRHITLVPVDPSKTPIYQATERFIGNIYSGFKQVQMGADVWGTFLRGIEQNGISRPLAGMAQIMEAMGRDDLKVISTNQFGKMLMTHDLYSLSSLMRIAGAKPLDEAMVNDAMFRVNTYRAKDVARKKELAEGIRTSIINGDAPDSAQINDFMYSYAKAGGKQTEFNKFMAAQYKDIKESKAEQLRENLSNPMARNLSIIMGED